MASVMAKKKLVDDTKVPFNMRINRSVLAALRVSANRNRRSITTEIEIACERYLKDAGLWSPPGSANEKEP